MKFIDITGQKFNYLQVTSFCESKGGKSLWECICDCGKSTIVEGYALRNDKIKSCGCFAREQTRKRMTTHDDTASKEHIAWKSMINRTSNPKCERYKNYGGRGISVCSEWFTYQNFFNDMGRAPSKEHSIDRIDVNGNYESSNCRWVDRKTQCRNRTSNNVQEYNGERLPLIELSEKYNVPYDLLCLRVSRGWNISEAINTPKRQTA